MGKKPMTMKKFEGSATDRKVDAKAIAQINGKAKAKAKAKG